MTEQWAEKIGQKLRGGECFELVSDLGGGKTTFTRGLVRGSGSDDNVSSPTFTINKQYFTPNNFSISHFDFYRLDQPGLVAEELIEVINNSEFVVVIEWAENVRKTLPENKISIVFKRSADNPEARRIVVSYPKEMGYLFKE